VDAREQFSYSSQSKNRHFTTGDDKFIIKYQNFATHLKCKVEPRKTRRTRKKTVILQRSFSMSLLKRSEKDLVLLHLQCNSQKISDFLWSRSETREPQLCWKKLWRC